MLTMHRPGAHARVSLGRRTFRAWLRDRQLVRFEIGCIAVFHIAVALILIFWDRDQVVTPGTSAIFGTIPLPVWAVAFSVTGVLAAVVTWRVTHLRLALMWCGVFPLGLSWTYGFAVAVTSGRGNALFALGWTFFLFWWSTIFARCLLGGSETRWGGG